MSTYAENAHRREIAARRKGADARDAEVHRAFDLIAKDNVAKFERPVFSVVGEGSRSSQENYRRNYDRIFNLSPSHRRGSRHPDLLPGSGAAAAG